MRDICFIDKTFDSTKTKDFHLSVQISPDGLYFAILDLIKGKYIVLNGYNFFLKRPRLLLKQVKEIVDKDNLLRLEYKSIEILYSTGIFTLVPAAFYSEKDEIAVMGFNHSIEKGFIVRKTYFQRTGAWCLFAMPESLDEYLETIFPSATIRHNLFPLIENGLKGNLNHPLRQQIHLNFLRDYFEIAVINGSRLLECNIFNYQTERDILYYVLYIFDQLKLLPEESEVIIHGHLPQVSPVYHLLKKYIRKTSFAKFESIFQHSYTFNQLPDHYFSSLLNVYKCE
jgi:hypothetical protein